MLYRQWAIPADRATAGIVFAGLFEPLSALVLPLIAVIGVIATGNLNKPQAIVLAAVGSASWSPRRSRPSPWCGRSRSHIASAMGSIGSPTPLETRPSTLPAGIVDGVMEFRVRAKDILTGHGVLGFLAAVVSKLAWLLVLELSLVAAGVTPDVLSPAVVLAAMAVVGIVALIPITPGAVGVAEVAYINILSAAAGPGYTEQITAAVVVFRIAQWFAVIPIGGVLLLVMRGGHLAGLLTADDGAVPTSDAPATT